MAGEPSDEPGPPPAGVARLDGIGAAAGDVPGNPIVTFGPDGRDGAGPDPPGDAPTAALGDLAGPRHAGEHGSLHGGAEDDRSRPSVTLGGLSTPVMEAAPVAGLTDLDGLRAQAQRTVPLGDLVSDRPGTGRRAESGAPATRLAGDEGGRASSASGRRARRVDRGRAPAGAARRRDGGGSVDGGRDATEAADRWDDPTSGDWERDTAGATGRDPRRDAVADGHEPASADEPRDRSDPRGRRAGAARELAPDADPVGAAREICLRLLSDRARTRQELAQALRRNGVPEEAAHTVLERFDEVGLIDDTAFAGQWVRSRHAHRGLARRAIALELRQKGVADDVAGAALGEVDAASEERRARQLVDRKLRSLAAVTPEQRAIASRRLVDMLARKGYGAGVAYRAVRDALIDRGTDSEELGSGEPPED